MSHTPHAFRWIDQLCYWIRLSPSGSILGHSSRGFFTLEEARADFFRWYK
jgi:hypothetical protein